MENMTGEKVEGFFTVKRFSDSALLQLLQYEQWVFLLFFNK